MTIAETGAHPSEALTRKLGPLPGWGWLLIVVGGAYGIYYVHGHGLPSLLGGTAPAPTVAATAPTNGIDSFPTGTPLTTALGGALPTTTPGVSSPSTNAQWTLAAANALIATGNYTATDVSNALANYINGTALTPQYQAIVNIAIKQFGVPPEGVVPITTAPAPTPPPTPVTVLYYGRDGNGVVYQQLSDGTRRGLTREQFVALGTPDYSANGHDHYRPPAAVPVPAPKPTPAPTPTGGHGTYTVRPGDNLSAIATRYYGTPDWQRIYNANKGIIANPNLIFAGQVLTIP